MPYKHDKKMLRVDAEDLEQFQRWQTAVNDKLEETGSPLMSQALFFGLILEYFHDDIDKWVGVS